MAQSTTYLGTACFEHENALVLNGLVHNGLVLFAEWLSACLTAPGKE
jgi:hypothetical protein